MIRKMLAGAFAALILAVVGLGFGARNASAEVVMNDRFSISAVFDNPCEAGDNPITVQGEYHRVDYTTPDGTLMMRFNAHYTGTDTDGREYVVNNTRTMEHWAWPSIPPFSDLIVMRLTSKGSDDNARIEMTIEYSPVFPTAYVTNVTCRG